MAARFGAPSRFPLDRRRLTSAVRPHISVAPWPNDVREGRCVGIGDGQA
jgi:hypothetical protein